MVRSGAVLLLLAAIIPAQVVGIDDLQPGPIPVPGSTVLGSFSGTVLGLYSAQALRERGVCSGAVLQEVAIMPMPSGTGLSGTYSTPTALLQIGHAVPTPVAGGWSSNLQAPITVHNGTYAFPWTVNAFAPLPGFAATGFTWDGVRDIGLLIATQGGQNGFDAWPSSQPAHSVSGFVPLGFAIATSTGAPKVRFTFAPSGMCAQRDRLGSGCYRGAWSFYEHFGNISNFDLSGTTTTATVLRCTPVASGYLVASVASAWRQPTSSLLLQNGSSFAMQDESLSVPLVLPFVFPFAGTSTSVIHAASNGFVLLGPTSDATNSTIPAVADLLATAPRLAPLWADLDPAVNPQAGVFFDVDASNQAVYVTWVDCSDGRSLVAAPQTSINMQCVLRSNGEFEFRYRRVALGLILGGAGVVGWSQGNSSGQGATDPGSRDLSTALPFSTDGPDSVPLQLDSTFPSLGSTWRVTAAPIPAFLPLALLALGQTPLPGPDLGAIGAPGCRIYSSTDIALNTFPAVFGTGVFTTSVPNNPQLLGVTFAAQAGAFTLRNPLGIATSNGLRLVLGN